ncbi:hypothetical protein EYF80_021841 [Liparis tanakae]|uniref:Uncharacterized protein n=1 Tax=Liparis tanakae TaxID=230148 RepID=A0A4Z2HSQ6_9TELE|nr:hypothetical protein EYF80_021841 [Liparis tanakae]
MARVKAAPSYHCPASTPQISSKVTLALSLWPCAFSDLSLKTSSRRQSGGGGESNGGEREDLAYFNAREARVSVPSTSQPTVMRPPGLVCATCYWRNRSPADAAAVVIGERGARLREADGSDERRSPGAAPVQLGQLDQDWRHQRVVNGMTQSGRLGDSANENATPNSQCV